MDPSEESRGVLRTLSVRAFGEGADDKYWKKGNLLMLKAVTVRPDEKCLKVTEEAIIEVFGEGTQVKAAEERQGAKLAAQN